MQTLTQNHEAQMMVKNSKFICYLIPIQTVKMAEEALLNIKNQHPKARHWCYAYRLGADGETFRLNDDGEPSGTAGMPIYQQLLSFEASDVLAVVVRYFGGILLGAGGLVKAYKDTTRLALGSASFVPLIAKVSLKVECDYAQLKDVYHFTERFGGVISEQDLSLFCQLSVLIPRDQSADFQSALSQKLIKVREA